MLKNYNFTMEKKNDFTLYAHLLVLVVMGMGRIFYL
jgi:hypothetical protein